MSYEVGEVVTRPIAVADSTGTAVDADTTPTYAVTLPDGSAGTPPSVQHGSTGTYWVEFIPALAGLHADVWTVLVGGKVVKFGPDVFNVRSASPTPIIGLAEARRHLRITSSDPDRDEELRDFIDAVMELIEAHTGRTYRRTTVTESHDGGKTGILLWRSPAQSIVSVTENGAAVSSTGYVLKTSAGVLYRGTTVAQWPWLPGIENITVTYVVVPAVVSAKVRHAAKVALTHLWTFQRGGSNMPRQVGSDGGYAAGSPPWSLPREVEQLLDDDMAAGFA